jgi:PAS domain S-box-containing protein
MVDQRVMARVNSLQEAEESERTLFIRMSGLLFLAFAVSVVLTVSLCLLISRMITDRIDQIRKNTERLADGDRLLPPLRGNDEISKLDKNFHDMANALLAADLRNQMILDNSIDLICAVDRDLQFVKVSNSCENFWQLKPDELSGRSLSEFIEPDLQLTMIKNFDEARESLEVKHFEAATLSSSRDLLPCLWSVQWSDRDQLFICVAHDNTKRKSAEARRQDLLAVISHDLRSPLTAARLSLEMLEHDKSLKDQSAHLDSASSSVNYVISVTNDLIDLLRIQQSRLNLELKLSTIARAKELIEIQMESQEIDMTIDVKLADKAYLMLDEDQLPRIIVSLAKHTKLVCGDAPVSLTISRMSARAITEQNDPDERIVFRVEPRGSTKTDANSRAQSAKRISSEISLNLCHEIAERLQGHIYTSWTAQGLPTYELRLPAVALG